VRVRVVVEGRPLRLGDVRRLFRETGGWSDECEVAVTKSDISSVIAVIETDAERTESKTAESTK
jgi:hypothetical protein